MQFKTRSKKKGRALINITSLIDVLFLLLIFLMVSSTFLEQPGIKLELPQAQSSVLVEQKEFTLFVNKEGKIFLNDSEINIEDLERKIKEVLDRMEKDYEIIFVDDGSRDKTFQDLQMIKRADKRVKIIKFRGNFGQTAALDAGFKQAKGDIILAMDADLQNDPADIPRLIAKLKQGYDCVSGWRKSRKDPLAKHIVSRGANLLRKIIIHDKIHDSGCTLKAYRKECFEDLDLFGEMHRFIPALLQWRGFKITELPVKHHP